MSVILKRKIRKKRKIQKSTSWLSYLTNTLLIKTRQLHYDRKICSTFKKIINDSSVMRHEYIENKGYIFRVKILCFACFC